MNTIKAGKLFCETYNEYNYTNYTPKEIFVNVIAPLLFNDDSFYEKDLVIWGNSAFYKTKKRNLTLKEKIFNFSLNVENIVIIKNYGKNNKLLFKKLNEYKELYGFYKNDPFSKFALNNEEDILLYVKNDNIVIGFVNDPNVMTSLNVFNGCACPGGNPTTLFSYSDNLYFDIDERYYSFIGSIFGLFNSGGFKIMLNNKEIIWELYKGILLYKKLIADNDDIKGHEIYKWNTAFFIEKYVKNNNDDNDIVNIINDEYYIYDKKNKNIKFINSEKNLSIDSIILGIIRSGCKIPYIELFYNDKTNKSCGIIVNKLDYNTFIKRYDLLKNLFKVDNKDFNYDEFIKKLDEKGLLYAIISNGCIKNDIFDPINYMALHIQSKDDKAKNKIIKKYLDYIMTDEVKKLSKKFAYEIDRICGDKKLYRNNINYGSLFKAKNKNEWLNILNDILNKTGQKDNQIIKQTVDYIYEDISFDDFKSFLAYSRFHSKLQK